MTITFYHSTLCPRCALVRKHLLDLLGNDFNGAVETVEVLTSPIKTWRQGIRMIPALKCGDMAMSGVMLSRDEIARFLTRVRPLSAEGEVQE